MPILKCKMCGGTLDVQEGMTVCECEYCGSKQTIPNLDEEKKVKLYERANKLRFNNEFDKAYSVYQDIVNEFSDDAEAYWGLLLCKYGIEYVEDPATHNRIPTCHRSSFESIMDDSDFEMVMENADSISRSLYREEAKKIEEIRKGIIEVSSKEEPYDIFICYKETSEDGQRTIDSVLAQDVYTELTNKGYKVFFSRITLEDKLGQEYEPYIFAALNSAKIMLAFGTSYDYYNAVWVKNEWSRYLQLMAKDSSKHLIPCYKNIDAYDMPKEFARLQAQDLGKVGATQDLLRGIEKILPLNKERETKVQNSNNDILNNLKVRMFELLEEKNYEGATNYANQVLLNDLTNPDAHLVKYLAFLEITKLEFINTYNVKNGKLFDNVLKYCSKDVVDIINNLFNEKESNEVKNKKYKLFEKLKYEFDEVHNYSSSSSYKFKLFSYIKFAVAEFDDMKDYKDVGQILGLCKDFLFRFVSDTEQNMSIKEQLECMYAYEILSDISDNDYSEKISLCRDNLSKIVNVIIETDYDGSYYDKKIATLNNELEHLSALKFTRKKEIQEEIRKLTSVKNSEYEAFEDKKAIRKIVNEKGCVPFCQALSACKEKFPCSNFNSHPISWRMLNFVSSQEMYSREGYYVDELVLNEMKTEVFENTGFYKKLNSECLDNWFNEGERSLIKEITIISEAEAKELQGDLKTEICINKFNNNYLIDDRYLAPKKLCKSKKGNIQEAEVTYRPGFGFDLKIGKTSINYCGFTILKIVLNRMYHEIDKLSYIYVDGVYESIYGYRFL